MGDEMKLTAVDWLLNELEKFENGESEFFSDVAIKNHARRMQKEQIIEFADEYGFHVCGYDYQKAEQYYNETYGE